MSALRTAIEGKSGLHLLAVSLTARDLLRTLDVAGAGGAVVAAAKSSRKASPRFSLAEEFLLPEVEGACMRFLFLHPPGTHLAGPGTNALSGGTAPNTLLL